MSLRDHDRKTLTRTDTILTQMVRDGVNLEVGSLEHSLVLRIYGWSGTLLEHALPQGNVPLGSVQRRSLEGPSEADRV